MLFRISAVLYIKISQRGKSWGSEEMLGAVLVIEMRLVNGISIAFIPMHMAVARMAVTYLCNIVNGETKSTAKL